MLKILGSATFGFVAAGILAGFGHQEYLRLVKIQHKLELDKMHSEAFQAGYQAAVDDPHVQYDHYKNFKALNESSQKD